MWLLLPPPPLISPSGFVPGDGNPPQMAVFRSSTFSNGTWQLTPTYSALTGGGETVTL